MATYLEAEIENLASTSRLIRNTARSSIGAFDVEDFLEDLIHSEKALQVLAAHIFREVLQFSLDTIGTI